MMPKRSLVVLLGLVLTTALFAAGGGESSAAADTEPIVFMRSHGTNPYAMQAQADDIHFKRMSDLSGINVRYEFLDHRNYTQMLTLRFASGDLPDAIITSIINPVLAGALESGIFQDITDLIDKYGPNIKKNIPEEFWKSPHLSQDGRIYGLPWMGPLPDTRVVYMRKDWLERLGMDPPVTIDDFFKLFAAIKANDANGNGDPNDEIPFGVRERINYSELFFGSYQLYPGGYSVVDGELMADVVNLKMKEVIKLWREMYQNGYVNHDMFTKTGGEWVKEIRSGVYGLWTHDAQNLTTSWNVKRFGDPAAEVMATPGPLQADGSGKYGLLPQLVSPAGWAVCSNGDRVVKLYDWAISDSLEKDRFFTFGVEGVNYTIENGKVIYDPDASVNTELNIISFLQVMINPAKDNRLSPLLLDRYDNRETIYQAIEAAGKGPFPNPAGYMGTPATLTEYPELGGRDGTLFYDMFAKVITGKEDLDGAWDAFTKAWYRRGGEELTKEINKWYKDFYGK